MSPSKTRKPPGEITIKVNCCARGCTLTTKGDDKTKTCWTCNSLIYFHRFPVKYVVVNGSQIDNNRWHIVNEEKAAKEDQYE